MQVRNEVAWAEQLTEFEADDLSRKFRDFLVFWLETADKFFEEIEPGQLGGWRKFSELEAISKAFELAEQTFGFLSIEWIAQMLLVITEHWERGEQLYESLSVFEKRLVEQATAMKLADLQSAANMPTEAQ